MPSLNVISARLRASEKHPMPAFSSEDGKETDVRYIHCENAISPMTLTPSGIPSVFSPVTQKEYAPYSSSPAGKLTCSRESIV